MNLCYILLLIMTMLGSSASFFLKRASVGTDGLLALIKNKHLYIGGGLYLASAVLNVIVLRQLD